MDSKHPRPTTQYPPHSEAGDGAAAKQASPGQEVDETREESFDQTLADSFPSSDPPSSIPDPGAGPRELESPEADQLRGLKADAWAAISVDNQQVVGTGDSQEEATEQASRRGFGQVQLVQVSQLARTPSDR